MSHSPHPPLSGLAEEDPSSTVATTCTTNCHSFSPALDLVRVPIPIFSFFGLGDYCVSDPGFSCLPIVLMFSYGSTISPPHLCAGLCIVPYYRLDTFLHLDCFSSFPPSALDSSEVPTSSSPFFCKHFPPFSSPFPPPPRSMSLRLKCCRLNAHVSGIPQPSPSPRTTSLDLFFRQHTFFPFLFTPSDNFLRC